MDNKEMDKKEMDIKEIQRRERDERAARRSLLREAVKDEEEDASAPASKKPRLDLLDMLSSSTTSVLDILTASGRKPLPTYLSVDQIIKESRPGVLDIFDVLPKEALAEDKEPAVEVVMEEDSMKDSMEEEVILDPYWFSGSPMEEDTIEETLLEEEDFCKKEEDAPTVQEIFAIAVTQEASSDTFPIVDEGFDVGFSFEADAQAKDNTHKTRSRRAYLSPALVWLEEEGLPTAEREARAMEKAIGVEMDEEEMLKRALQKWKMMGSEEKAVWRKRVEENANKKI